MLRYKNPSTDKDQLNINPQVSFNYLGKSHATVGRRGDGEKKDLVLTVKRDAGKYRIANVDVSAFIANNQLTVAIAYGSHSINTKTMIKFSKEFHQNILRITHYTSNIRTSDITPSDLVYDGLSIEDLDNVF